MPKHLNQLANLKPVDRSSHLGRHDAMQLEPRPVYWSKRSVGGSTWNGGCTMTNRQAQVTGTREACDVAVGLCMPLLALTTTTRSHSLRMPETIRDCPGSRVAKVHAATSLEGRALTLWEFQCPQQGAKCKNLQGSFW